MSARETIENCWDRATPVAPFIDAYAAEVRAATLREASEIAAEIAAEFYEAREFSKEDGAASVADRLTRMADGEEHA